MCGCDIDMCMLRRCPRCRTITGLCSVGNTELGCPEKWLEKLCGERYLQKNTGKGIQSGLWVALNDRLLREVILI